jgi:hypothetical protein
MPGPRLELLGLVLAPRLSSGASFRSPSIYKGFWSVTLTHAPQTIHQEEGGLHRLRANLYQAVEGAENRTDLILFTENFDDSADPEFGEEGWYMDDVIALTPTQAIAVREAIDSYLAPINTLTGSEPDWRPIEPPPIPNPAEQPIKWDGTYKFQDGPRDLLLEKAELGTLDCPTWKLTDDYGEEILLTRKMLFWLSQLMPAINRSYCRDIARELAHADDDFDRNWQEEYGPDHLNEMADRAK